MLSTYVFIYIHQKFVHSSISSASDGICALGQPIQIKLDLFPSLKARSYIWIALTSLKHAVSSNASGISLTFLSNPLIMVFTLIDLLEVCLSPRNYWSFYCEVVLWFLQKLFYLGLSLMQELTSFILTRAFSNLITKVRLPFSHTNGFYLVVLIKALCNPLGKEKVSTIKLGTE